jgi:hypothetical protein
LRRRCGFISSVDEHDARDSIPESLLRNPRLEDVPVNWAVPFRVEVLHLRHGRDRLDEGVEAV